MIILHSNRTTNSQKIVLMLEESRLQYRSEIYDILKGEHLTLEFGKLNPNHKFPVIVDTDPVDGGEPIVVFESAAILIYLAEKTRQFMPADFRGRSLVIQWLTWQVAGLGPMFGQAGHFKRYAPEGQDYGVTRYINEARRLLHVMDGRLATVPFLAGDYSVADMACWPWIHVVETLGIDVAEFPNVGRWHDVLFSKPVYRALVGGNEAIPIEYTKARMSLTEEQWSNTFGERMLTAAKRSTS